MLSAAAAALAAAVPLAQSSAFHRRQLTQIADLKREELRQTADIAEEALRHQKEQFCAGQRHALDLFAQSMSVQQDLARRETMRDVWQVRMQLNQTIIITAGLMFSCAFENLSQATIPPKTPLWMLYCLSGSTSVAIALLAASLWCCFKLQARIGGFVVGNRNVVYTCSKMHANFNEYFDCHCEALRSASVATFYFGTVAALASAAAIQLPKYVTVFSDEVAAALFTVLSFVASGAFLLVGDLLWPSKTHEDTEDFGGLDAFGRDVGMMTHETIIAASPAEQKKNVDAAASTSQSNLPF